MKPREQFELMNKIIRQLEDLKNSQTSVLKKLAQVETDNINLNFQVLSDALPEIHENVDDGIEKVTTLLEQFQNETDKYEQDHRGELTQTT